MNDENSIRLVFQRILARSLVLLLRILFLSAKCVGVLLRFLTIPIIRLLDVLIFQRIIVKSYKTYFFFKRHLRSLYLPSKENFLFLFSTRYVVHSIIILITLFVAVKNLSAQVTAEEIGEKSLLASLIVTQDGELIVETSTSMPEQQSPRFAEQQGSVIGIPKPKGENQSQETAIVTQEGAIVKPNIAATTVGERVREDIVYYEVQEGETISEIAEKYGIRTNTILWENRLGPRDLIKPGQQLTILPTNGLSYQVKSGDTIQKIAQRFGVLEEKLVEFNELASGDAIAVDQILILPDGTPPVIPQAPVPTRTRSRFASLKDLVSPDGPADAAPQFGSSLQWPTTSRKINQYFRWRHTGLDIDGESTSPIYASDDGRIEEVGWEGGYGLRVVINHGNGIKTHYAHISKAHVREGNSVRRGQTIATMGCTGWCTGSHVHFEVILGGKKVNPLSYL